MRGEPWDAADAAARRGGLTLRGLEGMPDLAEASALFETVWGRTREGAPVHSEVMRSLVHAGGLVSGAFAGGSLAGAAVLAPASGRGEAYGMIAATAPGLGDRGVGRALKLHQRAWGLDHGFEAMSWTFDPLVARNAFFNLTRLGARAITYEQAFYGYMSDELNGDDEADRLVARWEFAAPRVVKAAAGEVEAPQGPGALPEGGVLGPDGSPAAAAVDGAAFVRVPADIVALRRTDAAEASGWRGFVRERMQAAFGAGLEAVGCTRDGWYVFGPPEPSVVPAEGVWL